MLIKTTVRFPEIFFGMLLAVAIFATGMLFASSPSLQKPNAEQHQAVEQQAPNKASEHNENVYSLWVPTDSVGLYTLVLAAFTGILVLVSGAQGYFLLRADRTARIAAEAARDSAIKTGEMVDVASRQLAIVGVQADIQRKQQAIERLQYFAAHRPRLKVRHVTIRTGAVMKDQTFFFGHDAKIDGYLVVVNGGGSPAEIVETRYRIFATNTGLPPEAPYDDDFRPDLLIVGQTLGIGESCIAPISDKLSMPFDSQMGLPLRQFEREGWSLYVMGQIRYQDQGGAERFMAFCRERKSDGRFRAVDDPDYEYED